MTDYSKFGENVRYLLGAAELFGVTVEILDSQLALAKVNREGQSKLILKGKLPLNTSLSAKITKDKNLTKLVLAQAGLKVPRGILTRDWMELTSRIAAGALKYPLVVKPNTEALGVGVYARLEEEAELKTCFDRVVKAYGEALVEEYFAGDDHRFLVVDEQAIAVVKRLKPVVIGDGQKTVADLIKDYNAGRLRPVPKDAETLRNLQKQGLNLDSVPKSGGKVVLRENSNFRTGGIAQDVTETVAKEYFAIAEKAAELIGIRLCGVDLLIPQTAVFSDYCLTEVNSVPGFDVHLEPSVGPSRPEILGKVWDAIFTKE